MKKNILILANIFCIAIITHAQNANKTLSNLINPTKINVSLLPQGNGAHNIGNQTNAWRNLYLDSSIYFKGQRYISIPVNGSIAIGFNALNKIGKSDGNIAIGNNALTSNTSGFSNVAIGKDALRNNTTGYNLVAVGDSALFHQTINSNDINYSSTAIGTKALYSNTIGVRNTATGTYSLFSNTSGDWNTADGEEALYGNTTGYGNSAIGFVALNKNTTGIYNSGNGAYALDFNERSNFNTANGAFALFKHFVGNYNTANGYAALSSDTSGIDNEASGAQALYSNLSGNYNTAAGVNSLYYNTTGSNNAAFGLEALYINTTGTNNTGVGYHAGNAVTTGSNNTIVGYGADISDGTFSNATAIGNLAVSGASNRVRIGNGSVTSIGGAVGWTNFSDERIKTNIKQNVPGLAFINLLKPVTYNFDLSKEEKIFKRKDVAEWKEKYDIQKINFTGFLAQEVEAAAKKINYDFSGVDAPANDKDVYGLRYGDFVVPLVKSVQELSHQNDSLKSEIGNLKSEIESIKAMIVSNQSALNGKQLAVSSSLLQQNVPNPFSNSTTINYSLPQHFSSAKIIVSDVKGNTLKQINLSNSKGSVNIDAATLSSGAYQYALYVDERLIDTKQMILSK